MNLDQFLNIKSVECYVTYLKHIISHCLTSITTLFLGILLYEMLYGYTPFRGKTRQKTFANILHKDLKFPKSKPVRLCFYVYLIVHLFPTGFFAT